MKFINCRIDVLKKVFRPRPETEFWVGKALSNIKNKKSNIKNSAILDIFSGSGCIGIAVLKSSESACVDFVDISKAAISQIKIRFDFCQSSLRGPGQDRGGSKRSFKERSARCPFCRKGRNVNY